VRTVSSPQRYDQGRPCDLLSLLAVAARSARRGAPDPAVIRTEGLTLRKMWNQTGDLRTAPDWKTEGLGVVEVIAVRRGLATQEREGT